MYYDYIYYLLNKQAGGAISAEEEKILAKWYDSLKFAHQSNPDMEADRMVAWENLQVQASAWQQQKTIPINGTIRTRWNRLWIAAASVLLLLGMAGLWLVNNNKNKSKSITYTMVETARQKKSVTLPDGSVVWINAHSRLRFSVDFTNHRSVLLDQGEAFFDVQRDSLHPFEIAVAGLSVKVLGTSFNIQSFPELNNIKVSVTRGQVQVTDSFACRELLVANQQLVYTKNTHQYAVDVLDPQKTNDWKNGNIYLKNISLKELAVYIKNIYDYEVVFANKGLENCKNTINFHDKDPLKNVLEILKIINKVQYTISNKTIYLDGAGCQ